MAYNHSNNMGICKAEILSYTDCGCPDCNRNTKFVKNITASEHICTCIMEIP